MGLLQASDIDVQSCQLLVDRGSLSCIINLMKIFGQSGGHSTNVPACEAKSWSLLVSFVIA